MQIRSLVVTALAATQICAATLCANAQTDRSLEARIAAQQRARVALSHRFSTGQRGVIAEELRQAEMRAQADARRWSGMSSRTGSSTTLTQLRQMGAYQAQAERAYLGAICRKYRLSSDDMLAIVSESQQRQACARY